MKIKIKPAKFSWFLFVGGIVLFSAGVIYGGLWGKILSISSLLFLPLIYFNQAS